MRQGNRYGMAWVVLAAAMAVAVSGCRAGRTGRTTRADRRAAEGVGTDPVIFIDEVPMGEERWGYADGERGQFDVVYFGLDSSNVAPAERAKVEQVADYLRQNPGVSIIVEGHCCERGSAEYNLALGERRALAVRAYLVGLGIDPARIQTVSYGEEQPAVPGPGEHNLRLNRRSEFVLVR